MEEIKVKGIVVKAIDYKDSDKIVTIFSADRGLISARIRGVKKKGAKLVFAVQPFAFVEFLLTERDGFYNVINATSIDQFFGITSDFDNYIFMLACLEIIDKTVRENERQVDLFLLLLNSLKNVCYEDAPAINIFIKFLIESMSFLGFKLNFNSCAKCGKNLDEKFVAFSYDFNGLICKNCAKNNDFLEISAGEYAILKKINDYSLEKIGGLKFKSREDLILVISFLLKVFRINTDQEINSIKIFL